MERRKKRQLPRAALIVFFFIIAFAYMIRQPPEPRSFVTTKQFETARNLLFSYEITRYPTGVITVPPDKDTMKIGVIADPWNLYFGRIPRGEGVSASHRFVSLKNENEGAMIQLSAYGNITPYISFSKNDFILEKGENATVDIQFRLDDTTVLGNYSGEIDVIVSRPVFW